MDRWKLLNEETAPLVMVTVIERVFAFLVGRRFFNKGSFVGKKFCQFSTKASAHPDTVSAGQLGIREGCLNKVLK